MASPSVSRFHLKLADELKSKMTSNTKIISLRFCRLSVCCCRLSVFVLFYFCVFRFFDYLCGLAFFFGCAGFLGYAGFLGLAGFGGFDGFLGFASVWVFQVFLACRCCRIFSYHVSSFLQVVRVLWQVVCFCFVILMRFLFFSFFLVPKLIWIFQYFL